MLQYVLGATEAAGLTIWTLNDVLARLPVEAQIRLGQHHLDGKDLVTKLRRISATPQSQLKFNSFDDAVLEVVVAFLIDCGNVSLGRWHAELLRRRLPAAGNFGQAPGNAATDPGSDSAMRSNTSNATERTNPASQPLVPPSKSSSLAAAPSPLEATALELEALQAQRRARARQRFSDATDPSPRPADSAAPAAAVGSAAAHPPSDVSADTVAAGVHLSTAAASSAAAALNSAAAVAAAPAAGRIDLQHGRRAGDSRDPDRRDPRGRSRSSDRDPRRRGGSRGGRDYDRRGSYDREESGRGGRDGRDDADRRRGHYDDHDDDRFRRDRDDRRRYDDERSRYDRRSGGDWVRDSDSGWYRGRQREEDNSRDRFSRNRDRRRSSSRSHDRREPSRGPDPRAGDTLTGSTSGTHVPMRFVPSSVSAAASRVTAAEEEEDGELRPEVAVGSTGGSSPPTPGLAAEADSSAAGANVVDTSRAGNIGGVSAASSSPSPQPADRSAGDASSFAASVDMELGAESEVEMETDDAAYEAIQAPPGAASTAQRQVVNGSSSAHIAASAVHAAAPAASAAAGQRAAAQLQNLTEQQLAILLQQQHLQQFAFAAAGGAVPFPMVPAGFAAQAGFGYPTPAAQHLLAAAVGAYPSDWQSSAGALMPSFADLMVSQQHLEAANLQAALLAASSGWPNPQLFLQHQQQLHQHLLPPSYLPGSTLPTPTQSHLDRRGMSDAAGAAGSSPSSVAPSRSAPVSGLPAPAAGTAAQPASVAHKQEVSDTAARLSVPDVQAVACGGDDGPKAPRPGVDAPLHPAVAGSSTHQLAAPMRDAHRLRLDLIRKREHQLEILARQKTKVQMQRKHLDVVESSLAEQKRTGTSKRKVTPQEREQLLGAIDRSASSISRSEEILRELAMKIVQIDVESAGAQLSESSAGAAQSAAQIAADSAQLNQVPAAGGVSGGSAGLLAFIDRRQPEVAVDPLRRRQPGEPDHHSVGNVEDHGRHSVNDGARGTSADTNQLQSGPRPIDNRPSWMTGPQGDQRHAQASALSATAATVHNVHSGARADQQAGYAADHSAAGSTWRVAALPHMAQEAEPPSTNANTTSKSTTTRTGVSPGLTKKQARALAVSNGQKLTKKQKTALKKLNTNNNSIGGAKLSKTVQKQERLRSAQTLEVSTPQGQLENMTGKLNVALVLQRKRETTAAGCQRSLDIARSKLQALEASIAGHRSSNLTVTTELEAVMMASGATSPEAVAIQHQLGSSGSLLGSLIGEQQTLRVEAESLERRTAKARKLLSNTVKRIRSLRNEIHGLERSLRLPPSSTGDAHASRAHAGGAEAGGNRHAADVDGISQQLSRVTAGTVSHRSSMPLPQALESGPRPIDNRPAWMICESSSSSAPNAVDASSSAAEGARNDQAGDEHDVDDDEEENAEGEDDTDDGGDSDAQGNDDDEDDDDVDAVDAAASEGGNRNDDSAGTVAVTSPSPEMEADLIPVSEHHGRTTSNHAREVRTRSSYSAVAESDRAVGRHWVPAETEPAASSAGSSSSATVSSSQRSALQYLDWKIAEIESRTGFALDALAKQEHNLMKYRRGARNSSDQIAVQEKVVADLRTRIENGVQMGYTEVQLQLLRQSLAQAVAARDVFRSAHPAKLAKAASQELVVSRSHASIAAFAVQKAELKQQKAALATLPASASGGAAAGAVARPLQASAVVQATSKSLADTTAGLAEKPFPLLQLTSAAGKRPSASTLSGSVFNSPTGGDDSASVAGAVAAAAAESTRIIVAPVSHRPPSTIGSSAVGTASTVALPGLYSDVDLNTSLDNGDEDGEVDDANMEVGDAGATGARHDHTRTEVVDMEVSMEEEEGELNDDAYAAPVPAPTAAVNAVEDDGRRGQRVGRKRSASVSAAITAAVQLRLAALKASPTASSESAPAAVPGNAEAEAAAPVSTFAAIPSAVPSSSSSIPQPAPAASPASTVANADDDDDEDGEVDEEGEVKEQTPQERIAELRAKLLASKPARAAVAARAVSETEPTGEDELGDDDEEEGAAGAADDDDDSADDLGFSMQAFLASAVNAAAGDASVPVSASVSPLGKAMTLGGADAPAAVSSGAAGSAVTDDSDNDTDASDYEVDADQGLGRPPGFKPAPQPPQQQPQSLELQRKIEELKRAALMSQLQKKLIKEREEAAAMQQEQQRLREQGELEGSESSDEKEGAEGAAAMKPVVPAGDSSSSPSVAEAAAAAADREAAARRAALVAMQAKRVGPGATAAAPAISSASSAGGGTSAGAPVQPTPRPTLSSIAAPRVAAKPGPTGAPNAQATAALTKSASAPLSAAATASSGSTPRPLSASSSATPANAPTPTAADGISKDTPGLLISKPRTVAEVVNGITQIRSLLSSKEAQAMRQRMATAGGSSNRSRNTAAARAVAAHLSAAKDPVIVQMQPPPSVGAHAAFASIASAPSSTVPMQAPSFPGDAGPDRGQSIDTQIALAATSVHWYLEEAERARAEMIRRHAAASAAASAPVMTLSAARLAGSKRAAATAAAIGGYASAAASVSAIPAAVAKRLKSGDGSASVGSSAASVGSAPSSRASSLVLPERKTAATTAANSSSVAPMASLAGLMLPPPPRQPQSASRDASASSAATSSVSSSSLSSATVTATSKAQLVQQPTRVPAALVEPSIDEMLAYLTSHGSSNGSLASSAPASAAANESAGASVAAVSFASGVVGSKRHRNADDDGDTSNSNAGPLIADSHLLLVLDGWAELRASRDQDARASILEAATRAVSRVDDASATRQSMEKSHSDAKDKLQRLDKALTESANVIVKQKQALQLAKLQVKALEAIAARAGGGGGGNAITTTSSSVGVDNSGRVLRSAGVASSGSSGAGSAAAAKVAKL